MTAGPHSAQATSTKSKGQLGWLTNHFKGHATTPGHSSATAAAVPYPGGNHVIPGSPADTGLQPATHNGPQSNQHNSPSFEHGNKFPVPPSGLDQTDSEPYAGEQHTAESNYQAQPGTQVNEPSNVFPKNSFENTPQHQDQAIDSTQSEPAISPNAEPQTQTQSNDEYQPQSNDPNASYEADEQDPNSLSVPPKRIDSGYESSKAKFIRDASEEDYDEDADVLNGAYSEDF
ncbi:uncharacterized protein MYCFIDRAFT_180987 [Pseudocercospora fijiensis CIRAD86]|uniref:Uncharacterized protein n=1 Tax=Pseudocercospora fijiensis (strain CIRAD86) TaxID=383855 RepID=N1Q7H6_PSEFD|nr:uncharacterized protein MYCFIDRAFT_180987 [Pseudocercospora fijiensis CIRAD86]EME87586.1 hypothetical protein MYCFIDRAFT_180987 [Pseudocercospora fijiensis CIRAD86]